MTALTKLHQGTSFKRGRRSTGSVVKQVKSYKVITRTMKDGAVRFVVKQARKKETAK
ncbi:hypothetical protein GCM10011367_23010 [Marinicauda pacifica]|nr:hypothetical protein GCM10011367_23010 [Marinicauda pacifica]